MSSTGDLATIDAVAGELFADAAPHGTSLALVVVHRGEVIAERYGVQPANWTEPERAVTADTPLISWSMAKSVTHALVGLLVADGRLDPGAPAPVPGWAGTDKAAITLLDLLEMRSGLTFVEDYVDAAISHCIEMLFGVGQSDTAAYAAALPLAHEPGTCWNYSSGTTNIVARIVGDTVGVRRDGGHAGVDELLDRLFRPTGMTTATARFDDAGTFIGSSYVHASARDFARFGELYRNDGVAADGTRVLPAGWRDHAATFVATDPDGGMEYGRHWWRWPDLPGSLASHGYEGQYTLVVPDRELVVVHLGKSPADRRPPLLDSLRRIVHAIPAHSP
jgi:CubicO group peptidase (beta-lactamase class C family)